jgi:nicotinate-nucleotide adenylyltransferase
VPDGAPGSKRIGVFGSAFNPPQNAHLAVVEAAMRQFGLDRVIVVPTGDPYHKQPDSDPGPELRLGMARAAFEGLAGVEVSPVEVERAGPSYTYVTLERIEAENPESEIHLLIGADAALGFGGWERPERVLDLARVAVAPRSDVGEAAVRDVFEPFGDRAGVEFIEMAPVELSSSRVREVAAQGGDVGSMLPAAVAEIIENEGVYGSEQ